jgi:hypothetical protein
MSSFSCPFSSGDNKTKLLKLQEELRLHNFEVKDHREEKVKVIKKEHDGQKNPSLATKLNVGDNLLCKYRGLLKVIEVGTDEFKVIDSSKQVSIQSYRDIGVILFVITENKNKQNQKDINDTNSTCNDCALQRMGDCCGQKSICSFFRACPTISLEEKENWPKYGDATAFRMSFGRRPIPEKTPYSR